MKKKIICFDLDNVICLTKKNFYKKSKPNNLAIKKLTHYMNKVMRSRYSPQDIWEDVKKMLIVQKKEVTNLPKNN